MRQILRLEPRGPLRTVPEWRVEMLVPDDVLESVKHALYQSHPYEEPAFDLFRVEDVSLELRFALIQVFRHDRCNADETGLF